MKSKHISLSCKVKLLIVTIAAVAFIIFFPTIINGIYWLGYRNQIEPNTLISVSDWLGVYASLIGSTIGAAIAISGVYFTIKYSQQNDQERKRLDVIPFIAINRKYTKSTSDFQNLIYKLLKGRGQEIESGTESKESRPEFEEHKVKSILFGISNSTINIQQELTDDQIIKLKNPISTRTNMNGGIDLVGSEYLYVPLYLSNVGNGAAVNLSLRLYKSVNEFSEEFDVESSPICLKSSEDFDIGFFFSNISRVFGEYTFELKYYDIYKGHYAHKHLVELKQDTCNISYEVDQKYEASNDK